MTGSPAAGRWPFVIVESQLIVRPGFLTSEDPADVKVARALVGGAQTGDFGDGRTHTAKIDGGPHGRLTLVYRAAPIPGSLVGRPQSWVRDRATRKMFMIEGLVVCEATAPPLDEEAVAGIRAQTVPTIKRYLDRDSPRYEPDLSQPLAPEGPVPDVEPPDERPPRMGWPSWQVTTGLVALGGVMWEILRTLMRWVIGG